MISKQKNPQGFPEDLLVLKRIYYFLINLELKFSFPLSSIDIT
ncbi:hypothetical protein M2254_000136 [Chryseobacterium sp. BIGb0186]|nr:hypothetical protein [Chryseobacterium sp. JUb44]MDH6208552.1 hypothetical protein [Chryseobacterium sp. BIGb0186]